MIAEAYLMKLYKRSLINVLVLCTGAVFSQTLTTTTPQPKNAIIEEFTGIKCSACPDGHKIAHEIQDSFPGRVIVINIHADSWAIPSTGQPDFRTSYGNPIAQFAGAGGFPCGMVSRKLYTGNTLAMYREDWMDATKKILSSSSNPVNIGIESLWDPAKRELTVNVEMYFTTAVTGTSLLNIALLESHVIGYQKNLSGSIPNYDHLHALRDFITPMSTTWGDEITGSTQGKLITKTYKYIVDADWNIDNCELVAFLTQSTKKNTYTGQTIAAKNGTTANASGMVEITKELNAWLYPNPAATGKVNVEYRGVPADAQIALFNLAGKQLKTERLSAGNGVVELDVKTMPPGMYIYSIQTPEKFISGKLLLQ